MMKAGVNAIMGPSGSGKTRWGVMYTVVVAYMEPLWCRVKIDTMLHQHNCHVESIELAV